MSQFINRFSGICSAALPRQRSHGPAAAVSSRASRVLIAGLISEALLVCQAQHASTHEAESELTPSVIHWILAIILGVALVAGLVHVYRVLQKEDVVSPARRLPPEGMRAVQCGACHAMQHVTVHGRIFICFSCHNANRIAADIPSEQQQELIEEEGPIRCFEFKREGENFFRETHQSKIEPGDEEIVSLHRADAANPVVDPTNPTAVVASSNAANSNQVSESNAPNATNTADTGSEAGNGTTGDIEQGNSTTRNATSNEAEAQVIGRQDSENPSETSRRSRVKGHLGLPPCVVCLDLEGNMVVLPCAHGSVCKECVTRIAQNRASGGAHCPHCRSDIQMLVEITSVDGTTVKGREHRIPIARPV